jgi:aminoglycoside phosphotransferase (APT) family kinase protein
MSRSSPPPARATTSPPGGESPGGHLAAATVDALVAEQFPALASHKVAWLGSGWDHDLFSVGPEWILRFPQRADRVEWLARETTILAVLSEDMSSRIPAFKLAGHPSPAFPFPFVGYRRLPGVTAGQPAGGDLPGLARDIGNLLTQLHQTDLNRIPPCPGGFENEPWDQLRTELVTDAPAARALLPQNLLPTPSPTSPARSHRRPPTGQGGSSTTTSAPTTSSSTPPQADSPA